MDKNPTSIFKIGGILGEKKSKSSLVAGTFFETKVDQAQCFRFGWYFFFVTWFHDTKKAVFWLKITVSEVSIWFH